MHIIHLSYECYPVAKVGGLADVVGALPKYQQKSGANAWVLMPRFHNEWTTSRKVEVVHRGDTFLGHERFHFEIHKVAGDELGFPLYLVHVPGRLDRPGVYIDPDTGYGYWDEFERYMAFQLAALEWMKEFNKLPDIIHCHDHHTALVPFMMTSCPFFQRLESVPTILTIHNGEYHGNYDWGKTHLLPPIRQGQHGYLNWGGRLNALSAGIRKAWKVTTVSQSYMYELQESANGLEGLLRAESGKSVGIINGIDDQVWNPADDPMISRNFNKVNYMKGKEANKKVLAEHFKVDPSRPIFAFIGRLVKEKGADLLPDLITRSISEYGNAAFVVLGTGDPWLQNRFRSLKTFFSGYYDTSISYNEKLSHQIYAGADFILMPSRVEPCGLNQMYAMRYGTIPIVRSVGGLRDSVKDLGEKDGYGIRFDHFNLDDALHAVNRGCELYSDEKELRKVRKKLMKLDFSWNASAGKYLDLYKSLLQ